ncbi:hypothetical protein [Bradyrhizobium sp. SZCCHNR2032]|uniref:hypothetical protein n=1 Tax=Bradyrhizobium sp. SZCCHNR2032 TaxID=3057384 RepID=UPI002916B245|nr:hypothetical protein [Bradyrhizobium sp. SZCCHNR2032]
MITPIEGSGVWKVWSSIKKVASYVYVLGKRVATLESRVTELEAKLGKQPADACPYCGERAMRKTSELGAIFGSAPNQWKQEVWTCETCSKTETRLVYFKR